MRSQNFKAQLSKHWQPSVTSRPPLSGAFFQQVTLTKRRAPTHYSSCTTGTLIELHRDMQSHSSIIAGVMAERGCHNGTSLKSDTKFYGGIIFFPLLDCKGLLCVGGALMYVESPIKVDCFFPFFCKKFLGIVIKVKSIF